MSEVKTPKKVNPMGGPPGAGLFGKQQKARDFKGTMRQLIGYLKPFWWPIIAVFIFAIASTAFAIASPKILGRMTNQVVNDYIDRTAFDQITTNLPKGVTLPAGTTGAAFLAKAPSTVTGKLQPSQLEHIKSLDLTVRPSFNYPALRKIAYELVILFTLSALFSYIQGWIMTNVSQKISYKLRQDLSTKINRLPLSYFDRETHGEVLSRVTNDVDTVSQTLNQSLTQLVTSITMIIGILGMMFSISWQMTLIAIVTLPLSFLIIGLLVKRSQRYFKSQQDTLGHLNGHIEEMYSGHNVMKVNNGEKRSVARFVELNGQLYGSAWKSQFLSGLMMPLMSFVGNLNYVAICVVGGWLVIKGRVQIGDIQAFIQYANQFNQPIVQTANIANVLQSTAAAAERVFEFLAVNEEVVDVEKPVTLNKVAGGIEFNDVSFGYNPEKTVIKHFNVKIEPGQRVAIVGPTGAGKTTIVNLLMRFYDINRGTISIDGVETRQLQRSELRRFFGMVLQDTWLFSGSIYDNIKYGQPNASEAAVKAAAKAAHVEDFVHALPGGYQMVIDEEANNLSQGQKQLITIARAMLADPPMLILDEATSSVDTRTELLIQKAMERLMKNKTSFVIAHRLSTIRNADLILAMKNGNIVEQGTHEQLLEKKNGFYASLYNSQFADFDQPA